MVLNSCIIGDLKSSLCFVSLFDLRFYAPVNAIVITFVTQALLDVAQVRHSNNFMYIFSISCYS